MPSPPPARPLVIAHRGCRAQVPENTLPAFERALDLRVDGIEMDLHLSGDGQVLVSHDPRPLPGKCRLSTGPLPVEPPCWGELELSTIQDNYIADCQFELGSAERPKTLYTGRIAPLLMKNVASVFVPPTLEQVFALLAAYGQLGAEQALYLQSIRIFLEIKRAPFYDALWLGPHGERFEQCVASAIERSSFCKNVVVLSFVPRALQAIGQCNRSIRTALLTAHTPVNLLTDMQHLNAQLWCPYYQSIDRSAVEIAQAAGLQVIPWTVNDAKEMAVLTEWRVNGLVTDVPDLLQALGC
ncbi:glycerophosphodiester phosphodiesterase [Gloeobacter violaceus]|uniref:Glr4378 protein n=1 Tax=Gloeobacter violaceus (strain ATCC 29082 / PCC 7421) TaxID=251221 RepID=Q7ND58_GLOVI|nr:glycerophosphodiester phosphodiesterase [Gloeobacter violaceus]BAC92319.1 glr4378 [Gloeobacter violaceus PCC 7421]